MGKLNRRIVAGSLCSLLVATGGAAWGQSSASSYSYGTYNPVQAAINRDSMNAAIIRQSTGGGHKKAKKPVKVKAKPHR